MKKFLKINRYLKSRQVVDFSQVIQSDSCCYFKLWNLSGQLIGLQRHSPQGIKVSKSNETSRKLGSKDLDSIKYLTYVSPGQIGVFGLHTYKPNEILFITEGIFDAIMIHNAGYPAISMLSNNPKPFKSWLNTLPNYKIVIEDNDSTGKRLGKFGDVSYVTPNPYKDLNEMSQQEVDKFLHEIFNPPVFEMYNFFNCENKF